MLWSPSLLRALRKVAVTCNIPPECHFSTLGRHLRATRPTLRRVHPDLGHLFLGLGGICRAYWCCCCNPSRSIRKPFIGAVVTG